MAGRLMAAAVLGLTLPATLGAQGRRPPEFGSEITVVSLPVFVTNGSGRAIPGLSERDFEIFDEGKLVPIVGFREINAGDPLPDLEAEQSPAARRQFLLLFDLSFTSVNGLVRARQGAREFVRTGLGPRDLAAVATLSANHGVRLLVGFTADRQQLQRAIATLGVLQLDRKADPLGLVYDLTEVGSAYADEITVDGRVVTNPDDTMRQIMLRYQAAERADYRQRTLGLMEGMEQLGRALDALQGRKQVIFLSAGFDATAIMGQATQDALASSEAVVRGRFWEVRSEDRFGDSALRSEIERALRSFSTSDSLVHTVDVSGLVARGDSRFQGREPQTGSGQESLARIADLSGGKFFRSTNDVGEVFADILEMSRHYYLVAFEPGALRGPTRFHKLKVRVRGKGLRVSHRSGYFERAPFRERTALARQFEASELIAKGVTGGEIDLRVMAMPYRDASGRATLPVVLEVEGTSLLERAAGSRLGIEIYGYALGEHGVVEDFMAVTTNLDLPKVGDKLRQRGLQCHATFTLRPGRHELRFLVRDSESGRSGSQWLEVTVPSFEAAGVMLFPPLFMEDPGDWIVLHAPSRSTRNPESPFRVASEAFTPRTRPQLVNGRNQKLCLLAFDGGARYDPGASFEIRPALLASDGAPVPGRFQLARSTAEPDGFRRFVLSFTPQDVAPGDYTLRVRLRDPASGRISEAFQAVRVE